MKRYWIILTGLILALAGDLHAQSGYYVDALRYMQTYPGGSARYRGFGGAQVSLGGDIGTISGNPAGLGFYNHSEGSLTAGLLFKSATANYRNQSTDLFSTGFGVPNVGVVINTSSSRFTEDDWRASSFGISINQEANFQQDLKYQGDVKAFSDFKNPDGTTYSAPNDFVNYALQGIHYDNNGNVTFDNQYAQMAWNTYLLDEFYYIDQNNGDSVYFLDRYNDLNVNDGLPTRQVENIYTSGGITSVNFAYGGNYRDKLYLGIGLGVKLVNYQQKKTYKEIPTNTSLDYYTLQEELDINGSGVDATFGVIYKPIPEVNVGVAYTSPSLLHLKESQTLDMNTYFSNGDNYYDGVKVDQSSYDFRTPQRLKLGATFFVNKSGFLSADAEYIDYGKGQFSSSDISVEPDNQAIKSAYKSTWNYRVGGEVRLDMFRLRAGYSYFGNPYQDNFAQDKQIISGGVGIKKSDYYVDLAIQRSSMNNRNYIPYPNAPTVTSNVSQLGAYITVGFSF